MKTVIEVENLSKKYLIYHTNQGAYSTIVESLSRSAEKWVKSLAAPFRKASSSEEPTSEEFWALKDVFLECKEGDRIGILGKNGAGKSTLLKVLSRIVEPTAGKVRIRGRVSSLLEVGTGFHPELTGRENIFLNGAILGMAKQEITRRFDEIVAFSEIEQFLDTPVKYYSSGMYARLGFAIAAHLDPDILIVDEVLAVGDAAFQDKCLKKLDNVSKNGKTILFVSHNTAAILHLCNKGVLMEKGRVKALGLIEECVNQYIKTYRPQSMHWEGDLGDSAFRVRRVSILGDKEFFYAQDVARIEVHCEVNSDLEHAVFGLEIKDQRDQVIAHSYVNEHMHIWKQLKSSRKCTISLDLHVHYFWEGEYTISFVYFIPQKHHIIQNEIQLKFIVYRAPPNAERTAFLEYHNKAGVILPSPWNVRASSQ